MLVTPFGVDRALLGDLASGTRREWLETNGLGSFAMGTVSGPGTRRYHALLCLAARPPCDRYVMVNRCEETLFAHGTQHELSANFYPGAVYPQGHLLLREFRLDPWPVWTYRLAGVTVEKTVFMPHGLQATICTYRLLEGERARLSLRPLLSGRDYHALQQRNAALNATIVQREGMFVYQPYPSVPSLFVHHNGVLHAQPDWYLHFVYPVELERGLPNEEDLFSPGELTFELSRDSEAVVVFSASDEPVDVPELRQREQTRRGKLVHGPDDFSARLELAADQFVVKRGEARTLIAGYPWFTDWGRDAFVSLHGLALSTGRIEVAEQVLQLFADHIRDGLLPNRFPDESGAAEYNSVDAPLWFVLTTCRFLRSARIATGPVWQKLTQAIHAVIDSYLAGTKYDIGVDDDGLIHAGAIGVQLTWMDAKVDDWVVTPRMGKPVEIQALWIAALEATTRLLRNAEPSYASELADRADWARSSFPGIFFSEELGYLYDVVDGNRRDATLRPNQLYALSLCAPLVDASRAERILAICDRELRTPFGLRSRARGIGYHGKITGTQRDRDAAYHQGTVWSHLLGVYADASMRVRQSLPADLLDGMRQHLFGVGMGRIYEIFDGDEPHHERGCISQAWSVAEVLRIVRGEVGTDA